MRSLSGGVAEQISAQFGDDCRTPGRSRGDRIEQDHRERGRLVGDGYRCDRMSVERHRHGGLQVEHRVCQATSDQRATGLDGRRAVAHNGFDAGVGEDLPEAATRVKVG